MSSHHCKLWLLEEIVVFDLGWSIRRIVVNHGRFDQVDGAECQQLLEQVDIEEVLHRLGTGSETVNILLNFIEVGEWELKSFSFKDFSVEFDQIAS